jgi:hypothetical protein
LDPIKISSSATSALCLDAPSSPKHIISASKSGSKADFKGLKKGFFNNSKPKTPSSSTSKSENQNQRRNPAPAPEIIRPKQEKEDAFRFEEVQEAMKANMGLLDKKGTEQYNIGYLLVFTFAIEWLSQDFISTLENSSVLKRAFKDPEFSSAIDLFVKNPESAFRKYSQSKPEFIVALREFSGLLGEKLNQLADSSSDASQPKISNNTPKNVPIPEDLPEHEKLLIREVQNNPELQHVLQKPNIQKLLLGMRTGSPDVSR